MTTFGATIRVLRHAAALTQRDLAGRLGVDFSYISKIEHDALPHTPSEALILGLARELHTDPETLLSLAGKFNARALQAVTAGNPDAAALIRHLLAGDVNQDQLAAMLAIAAVQPVAAAPRPEGPPHE